MPKPRDLKWPCVICTMWNEEEYTTHDYAAAAFWQGHKRSVKTCRYDPRYAAPDLSARCPYRKYFGKPFPLVCVSCDFCGKTILEYPLDRPNEKVDNSAAYICNLCFKKTTSEMIREAIVDKKLIVESELYSK
jgi:hypothetical protein